VYKPVHGLIIMECVFLLLHDSDRDFAIKRLRQRSTYIAAAVAIINFSF
jgi:hypothetical protein